MALVNRVAGLLARLAQVDGNMPVEIALPGGRRGRPAMLEEVDGKLVIHVNVLPIH